MRIILSSVGALLVIGLSVSVDAQVILRPGDVEI